MKRIEKEELDYILGCTSQSISGPIISAFVNIIKLLVEAGSDVGSSIRRVSSNNMCPMK